MELLTITRTGYIFEVRMWSLREFWFLRSFHWKPVKRELASTELGKTGDVQTWEVGVDQKFSFGHVQFEMFAE